MYHESFDRNDALLSVKVKVDISKGNLDHK